MVTTVKPDYDQSRWLFEPVGLDCGAEEVCWQVRIADRVPWQDLPERGRHLTVDARWRDIGNRYRALAADGTVLGQWELGLPELSGLDPADFGALGDGRHDDGEALQSAFDQAAIDGVGVDLKGRTYATGRALRVRDGVSAVFGGTLLQLPGAADESAIVNLVGRRDGEPTNVCRIALMSVRFAMTDAFRGAAVLAASASHVAVIDCEMVGCHAYAVRFVNHGEGGQDVSDLVVRGNRISTSDGGSAEPECAVFVESEPIGNMSGRMNLWWLEHFDVPEPIHRTRGVAIIGNDLRGGYYGVCIHGVNDVDVLGNHVRDNMRNMSFQNRVTGAVVAWNEMTESVSSAIHFAYGSHDNLIHHNSVSSGRAIGEGLLQAYVGAKRNHFHHNDVVASGIGPKYHAYCGVHADANRFEDNLFSGTCQKAYIALESGWSSTNDDPSHRSTGLDGVEQFTREGTRDVVVARNRIRAHSPVPLVVVAEIDGWPLEDCIVEGNRQPGYPEEAAVHSYAR